MARERDETVSKDKQEAEGKSDGCGEDAEVVDKESKSSSKSSATGEWRQHTCTNLEYY